jgi:hypothetical protein
MDILTAKYDELLEYTRNTYEKLEDVPENIVMAFRRMRSYPIVVTTVFSDRKVVKFTFVQSVRKV